MRVFGIQLGFNPATFAAGVGIALLAPSVVSAAPRLLRSAAKTVIKAGYIISNKMRIVYWDKEPSVMVGGSGKAGWTDAEQGAMVYVAAKGKKYHKENCPFAIEKARALTLSEALRTGYEPCKVCGA